MDDFDIEKQTEPPSDYVSWSLNNFKVEDVGDSALCNFDPWDTDSCGAVVPDLPKSDFSGMNVKSEFDDANATKSEFSDFSYDKMDLKDMKVEPAKMEMSSTEISTQFTMPDKIDPETLVTEDKLSIVDLGHICEIVGNKEDAEQAKQFICLYCGLQLGWTHLCLHMKFGHNSHDKVKLCKRFDCEYHSKMKTGTDADPSLSASSASLTANNNNAAGAPAGGCGNGGKARQAPVDPQEAFANGAAAEASAEPRKCPDCPFVTSRKSSLREHVKYNHPKEEEPPELHRCLICGFKSKYKYGLKKHAKKHSKLTLHKCPCCDYSTILPLLLEHIKFKHTDEQLAWSSMATAAEPAGGEPPGGGAHLEIRPLAASAGPAGSGPAAAFEIMPGLQLPQ